MNDYLYLRRNAILIPDEGGFNLNLSQMNPLIFEKFLSLLVSRDLLRVVWEPFAGTISSCINRDLASKKSVELLDRTLNPENSGVKEADSTVTGPCNSIGGMLFHPPYFASSSSNDPRDIAISTNKDNYVNKLHDVVYLANNAMVKGGLVCSVGRDYRRRGMRANLPEWYIPIFEEKRYVLKDVWISEPDIILIFQKHS